MEERLSCKGAGADLTVLDPTTSARDRGGIKQRHRPRIQKLVMVVQEGKTVLFNNKVEGFGVEVGREWAHHLDLAGACMAWVATQAFTVEIGIPTPDLQPKM
ncbi:hypothetical protein GOP47_0001082 [Adiantum capillus-veneris]|uniref:Uncharacterized protein n=1 Tax=Adiantum capillus-veneris TaxID=13818 RepID=A0A9D4VEQ8_ADICA|nr:hypothetical protein GOP47_0001082 [Adiantum capillus-veneris]